MKCPFCNPPAPDAATSAMMGYVMGLAHPDPAKFLASCCAKHLAGALVILHSVILHSLHGDGARTDAPLSVEAREAAKKTVDDMLAKLKVTR